VLAALSLALCSGVSLHAQSTVATMGGGSTTKPYSGYVNGNTLTLAKFSMPAGLAMNPSGTTLFMADSSNNAVRMVSQAGNTASSTTTTFATNAVSHPLAVVVDAATNVFVLNHGTGSNGSVLRFNSAGTTYATLASGLVNATAMALDGLDNCYVTVNGNKVICISTNGVQTTVGTIATTGTALQGIAWLSTGQLALADAGNNGIFTMNPTNGAAVALTGFHGAGDVLGVSATAAFRSPETISAAGGGMLVVADYGNNKVKLVDNTGNVTLLYGVSSNLWITGTGTFPGWRDGAGTATQGSAESRLPYGVVVSYDGSVFASEDYYDVLRHVTGTGLSAPTVPGSGSGTGSGTGGGGGGASQPFAAPAGIAYDSIGNLLFVPNTTNGTVQVLDLNVTTNATSTFLTSGDGLANPAAVLLDADENVYVLNRATPGNGYISEFDIYGNSFGAIITGLNQPTAFTMDGYGNILVAEQAGKIRLFGASTSTTLATITNANVSLQGIALFDDTTIAVSDAGNHVIWTVNPINKLITKLTGQLGVSGLAVGTNKFAELNQPHQLVRAAGNQLLAADYGNNRLVVVSRTGTVTTNHFNYSGSTVWFGNNAIDSVTTNSTKFVSIVQPFGVAITGSGEVFDSETRYSDIRGLTGTTLSEPASTPGIALPAYSSPAGIALNMESTLLFIAAPTNNTISVLNLANNQTTPFLDASEGLSQPVDVAFDISDNLYVLNQGTAGNGFILEFDPYGNLLTTNASGLAQPVAMTLDSSGDILIAEAAGAIQQITFGSGASNTVATVTNAGTQLAGIALLNDGTIAVSDAGNDVIWQVNPSSHAVTRLTGQLHSPGTTFGSASFAKLYQPHTLKLASGNQLVAADSGNNRIVVISSSGTITNALNSTNATLWFGLPTDPVPNTNPNFIPMVTPIGLAIGTGGGVFASETYYNDIRELLGTGVGQTGPGGSGGTGTNIVVPAPTISPDSGYYPMGQNITVQSPAPQVYYTTDGSDPTTNSLPVTIEGNVGSIHWFNTTNDLRYLRVRGFLYGTNSSAVVAGQPVPAATIGVPLDYNPSLQAGIGSTVVIPVVCNLATNQQIESYQFRVEIAPLNNPNTPVILPLSITPTNDFVPLVTAAQTGLIASNTISPYTLGATNGLTIFAVGSGTHILFHSYAVIALLEVQIPYTANEGDLYSLNVLYPSATADAYDTPVTLTGMPQATIVVTNIPYTVGDSASPAGAWYNAGTFGNTNLDNSDVNQAFYAASGLRVPYAFSDVYNAMDAYPADAAGFVGGDGQIRFLDWVTILQRSLRLDPGNWAREWSEGGLLTNYSATLVTPHALRAPAAKVVTPVTNSWPWYRQVLLGAESVGNVSPNSTVYVPVYAKLADGSSLSGLQFRAQVAPLGAAPALATAPQLALGGGVASPMIAQSLKAGETAFGWNLGSFDYSSSSSNFLGWITFIVPTNALPGQSYQVSLLNADGAPNATNQYDFETRSATVTVNASAPPATICSDEWKIHFFGSTTNPAAADNADPDGDGVPNWMEFLAGTDPTSALSKLKLASGGLISVKAQSQMQLNWLTSPGRAYALQWSSSLASSNWQTLSTVSGNGTVTNCADANPAGAARYYRLTVLP
jgi:sugar lactone lactonase YvrE